MIINNKFTSTIIKGKSRKIVFSIQSSRGNIYLQPIHEFSENLVVFTVLKILSYFNIGMEKKDWHVLSWVKERMLYVYD